MPTSFAGHCLFTCKNCNSTRLWKGWEVENKFLVYTEVGNPLIGWTSTGDPLSYVGEAGLSFDSVDATNAFAEKHVKEKTVMKDIKLIRFLEKKSKESQPGLIFWNG
ncbi:hypothetical protein KY289_021655 [Solanum tuberosum]|nr:hypothetical protein KY289_021655 [Solanum tuberosum]